MVEVKLNKTSNETLRSKFKKVHNVGINDLEEQVYVDSKPIKSYEIWVGMLRRCYDEKYILKQPTYKGCSVTPDWLYFSNFKKWFDDNYNPEIMSDWQLDKDLLIRGNKAYSPHNCCFVPQDLNLLFIKSKRIRGKLPIGVYFDKQNKSYKAYIRKYNKLIHIGYYDTIEEAFIAYKTEKEKHIKEVADKYKEVIDIRLYNVMYNYEVKLED